jgi:zinc protease
MFPLKAADIKRVRLDNGLTVMGLEYRKLPLAHITMMIKRGSERDPEGKEGLADLTAEMLTLGTKGRDSQQLALEMEQLGAQYSASSGWDASFLEVFGLSQDFAALMDLVGDMLLQPTFPQEEMQQSQQRRISRLIQQRDQAEVITNEIIVQRLLEHTPYAHPTYGTIPSLGGMAGEDPSSFYHHHYSPKDTVLLVIGDLTFEDMRKGAEALLGHWKAERKANEQLPSLTRPIGRKIIAVNRPDLTQSQIRVGLLGIQRKDEHYIPFKVMNYIFGGGGFSSRLMQRIRAEKGYTYGISSSFQAGHITGPFIISTFTPTATIVPVLKEIVTVMEEFITKGAHPQELEEAKNFFRGSFPLQLETPGQMAGELLKLELYDIPFDYLSSYPETIGQVTLDEVNSLASSYLLPEDFIIVVVGRAEGFVEPLRNWGEVELIEYTELVNAPFPSKTSKHASTTCGS